MKPEQASKSRVVLGVGEYGCWECTLIPQTPDPGVKEADQQPQPEKMWVVARSIKEVAENIPGVESAVLLGKATCIADAMTPGVKQAGQDIKEAITEARPLPPPVTTTQESRKCPFCGETHPLESFIKPEGIVGDSVACPACKMLSNPARLVVVK